MTFSIAVANYNNNQYLTDLIKSVVHQTFTDWELIIVDDCSPESPLKYIEPFLSDARIKYLQHDRNKGAAATFKTATENATGEIIGLLGADDALVPEAVEKMVRAHSKYPDASLINSDSYSCDEQLNILHKNEAFKALVPGKSLIRDICIGNFVTFKKAAYLKTEGFSPLFKKALDHDIYLKLDEVGSLEYVHEPLYLYRKNPIGISQNSNGIRAAQYSLAAKYNAYRRRLGTAKENLSKKEITAIRIVWYTREIYNERVTGNKQNCNKLIRCAIKEVPSIVFNKVFIINSVKNIFTK